MLPVFPIVLALLCSVSGSPLLGSSSSSSSSSKSSSSSSESSSSEEAGPLFACIKACREPMENAMIAGLDVSSGDINGAVCEGIDAMFDCLQKDCQMGELMIQQVKSTVSQLGMFNCSGNTTSSQTQASPLLSLIPDKESVSSSSMPANFSQVKKVMACLDSCEQETSDTLAGIIGKPLDSVMSNVTVQQALLQTDKGCRAADQFMLCMKKRCDMGEGFLTHVTSMVEGMELLKICQDKELRTAVLECEIENRSKFTETCGEDTLSGWSEATDKIPELMKDIKKNPLAALTPAFRQSFDQLCKYNGDVVVCSSKVYKNNCKPAAYKYLVKSMQQMGSMASPEGLSILGDNCVKMAEQIQSVGQ